MLSNGQHIGHYQIRSQIGAGGMGEVYLALDTELNRTIALKILPAEIASNEERIRRFVQEAQAAAALNHPNIAHVYEIGEADGSRFIAMEYVDGVTLYEKIQLTVDAGANYDFKISPDNRYIVFTSERTGGMNLWRMDLDGGNPKQLTNGNSDFGAAITPDSRWVIYNSDRSGKPAIWKVSIDGGDSTQLTEYVAFNPEVSPDGKLIVCQYREEVSLPVKWAFIPIDGGKPTKVFDLPGDTEEDIRWSPDGRTLTYITHRNGVSNIWSFPLDGGQPKQLTDFKTDQIYNFKWSPDGKNLVLARGTTTSDVVLIRDFK